MILGFVGKQLPTKKPLKLAEGAPQRAKWVSAVPILLF